MDWPPRRFPRPTSNSAKVRSATPRRGHSSPPAIDVGAGVGTGGADRVTIRFNDDTIENAWLRVVVKANANTGLATEDVHYWGNTIGETGDSPLDTRIDFVDAALIRQNFGPAAVTSRYDINRSGVVDAADASLVESIAAANNLHGDRSRDDIVGVADLAIVQSYFGRVGAANNFPGDVNGDGSVNRADVKLLAEQFGRRATLDMLASRLPLLAAPATSTSAAAAAIVVRVGPDRYTQAVDAVHRHSTLAASRGDRSRGERSATLPPMAVGGSSAENATWPSGPAERLHARRSRGGGERAVVTTVGRVCRRGPCVRRATR